MLLSNDILLRTTTANTPLPDGLTELTTADAARLDLLAEMICRAEHNAELTGRHLLLHSNSLTPDRRREFANHIAGLTVSVNEMKIEYARIMGLQTL